jgi:hypothetical protein
LEHVTRALTSHLPPGKTAELAMDEGEQLVDRGGVAAGPLHEQRCDVVGATVRHDPSAEQPSFDSVSS